MPGDQPFDADVLIDVRPFDRVAIAEEPPILPFRLGRILQPWIPLKRHVNK